MYLGKIIDGRFNFRRHVEFVSRKASVTQGALGEDNVESQIRYKEKNNSESDNGNSAVFVAQHS